MAETSCAQAAPVAPQSSALATSLPNAESDALRDPTPLKAQPTEGPDAELEELPDLSVAQSSSLPLDTPQSTPDLAPMHTLQPTPIPAKTPSFRKVSKAKTRAKALPKVDVVQPLAPALSTVSHPLATIPLAPALSAAYPFPALANPNLLPHPFVSLPLQAPRRAVRIAPMGVIPLPPPGAAALVADFHAAAAAVVPDEPPRIQELSKAKRRGASVTSVVPEQALTPEERTRQKRMLRNRESAARSRDKRRNRNIQLQTSIQRYRDKKKALDDSMTELKLLCDTMRHTLEKHNIPIPP
eukprot:TRINITY_DN413_c0_g3_i1.p2 TRINITY_DN413_c0_g3~~TRINITY_DN413_c0_g3_i1.p2  ORF type:complete len:316 (-),score=47.80 TRINITY_DN413_c0_g3_i1:2503-3396(-)